MARTSSSHVALSETPTFDDAGDLRVVIETPKGSRNKYDYDPQCDCMDLATVLPEGMSFPYDFGFAPSTLGEDGDPLDILVFMDAPVVPRCVIHARLIGAIEAKPRKKSKSEWIRNDRLLAVACHAQTHQDVRSIKGLRPHLVDEIKAFFIEYNALRGREFKPQRDAGPGRAQKLLKAGVKAFRQQKNGHAR
ncbi:MAG TPA: inorganic diphosphatase [Stellaceae bacterium]|jgi:inorganic pyrophosphatase|nr:inorganic diphosphatase [Stellaceae bacterium]